MKTIEEFDKALNEAADVLIADSKAAQEKWMAAIEKMVDSAGETKLPEHLVLASVGAAVKRIEAEAGE